MFKNILKSVVFVGVSLVVLSSSVKAADHKFVGSKKCNSSCHDAWQVAWKSTVHANSYNRLLPNNANNPECLWCHTTGYGKAGGFDPAKDGGANFIKEEPNLAAVGCEMCHSVNGGSEFRKTMKETKGKFHINQLEEKGYRWDFPNVCKRCHEHPKNPHKKKFDFAAAMKDRDKYIHKEVKMENEHKNGESKTAKNPIKVEDYEIQGGKIVFK